MWATLTPAPPRMHHRFSRLKEPMSARRFSAPIVILIASLASGCRDGLGPADIAGTYVLERVGGAPLPAEVFRDRHSVMQVLADTLRLRDDGKGRYTSTRIVHAIGQRTPPDIPTLLESDLEYRIVGLRIDISFACPIAAACIDGPHFVAHQSDAGLIVGSSLVADAPLRYRRVM